MMKMKTMQEIYAALCKIAEGFEWRIAQTGSRFFGTHSPDSDMDIMLCTNFDSGPCLDALVNTYAWRGEIIQSYGYQDPQVCRVIRIMAADGHVDIQVIPYYVWDQRIVARDIIKRNPVLLDALAKKGPVARQVWKAASHLATSQHLDELARKIIGQL